MLHVDCQHFQQNFHIIGKNISHSKSFSIANINNTMNAEQIIKLLPYKNWFCKDTIIYLN